MYQDATMHFQLDEDIYYAKIPIFSSVDRTILFYLNCLSLMENSWAISVLLTTLLLEAHVLKDYNKEFNSAAKELGHEMSRIKTGSWN